LEANNFPDNILLLKVHPEALWQVDKASKILQSSLTCKIWLGKHLIIKLCKVEEDQEASYFKLQVDKFFLMQKEDQVAVVLGLTECWKKLIIEDLRQLRKIHLVNSGLDSKFDIKQII
jgi:hypothetical protein